MEKAKKFLSEEFVKRQIIQWLSRHGWGSNLKYGDLYEKGVDIRVKKNTFGVYFLIETKGEGQSASNKEVFLHALGQIVTRVTVPAKTNYKYGIGLPESIAKTAMRRIPWRAAQRLKLHILSVDKTGKVTQYRPKDLKKLQNVNR